MRRFDKPVFIAALTIVVGAVGCSDGLMSSTPTSEAAALHYAAWDGGPIYVDPTVVIFAGDPVELPRSIVYKGPSRDRLQPENGVDASECFVDGTRDPPGVLCSLKSPTPNLEDPQANPWIIAIVIGVVSNWIWDMIQPGWWDEQLMYFITNHCDARGMATQFVVYNGALEDWACLEPQ